MKNVLLVPAFVLLSFAFNACASADTDTAEDAGSDKADASRSDAKTSDEGDDPGDPGNLRDGGDDPNDSAADTQADLKIEGALFNNIQNQRGTFYNVNFTLSNTSDSDVKLIESLSFSFGGSDRIEISDPPCNGSFVIESGKKREVRTQIEVSANGTVTLFSFICGSSQRFTSADGTAPVTGSFAGPVAIAVEGATESGTFTANGSASRTDEDLF